MPVVWGSLVKSDVVGCANGAEPLPRPEASSGPHAESRTHEAGHLLPGVQQVTGLMIQLLIYQQGNPRIRLRLRLRRDKPGSPGPNASSLRSEILSIKRASNPSPIADHEKCERHFPRQPHSDAAKIAASVRAFARIRTTSDEIGDIDRSAQKRRARIAYNATNRVG